MQKKILAFQAVHASTRIAPGAACTTRLTAAAELVSGNMRLDKTPVLTKHVAWTRVAHRCAGLGLGCTYYLVLGPVSLVARVMGVTLLDLEARTGCSSWSSRTARMDGIDALEREF